MIGKVVKIYTRRIDLNMVDYLRVEIILDVTKPIRRCVAIGAHALKDDIDVESSTVVPPAAVTLPPDVLAHGNDDASTNEEADDADH
ncbi:hypothetical protein V6N12_042298 [Hibiscus sabdariffa]|uniref:Uncharacterized protein n=1 Tax=Hibiscus sabdariffa TaxID=183260 RepID=A0ABR2EED8_9ROSI